MDIRNFIACSLTALKYSERGVRLIGSPSYGIIKYSIGDIIVEKVLPNSKVYLQGKHDETIRMKVFYIYRMEGENYALEAAVTNLNWHYVPFDILDFLGKLRGMYEESYILTASSGDQPVSLAHSLGYKFFRVSDEYKNIGIIFPDYACSYTFIGDEDDLYQSALYTNMVTGKQIYKPIIKHDLIWG